MVLPISPPSCIAHLLGDAWVFHGSQPRTVRDELVQHGERLLGVHQIEGLELLLRAQWLRVQSVTTRTADPLPCPEAFRAAWVVSMTFSRPDLQPLLMRYARAHVTEELPVDWHLEHGASYPLPGPPSPEVQRRYAILMGTPAGA